MMMSVSSQSSPGLPTTCWSLVVHCDPSHDTRAAALGELCQRYWYPVYAYLRHSGHAPEIAQDITRAFLADLLREPPAATSQLPRPRFRDFLLERLRGFLAADWRDLPVADATLPEPAVAELEARNRLDHAQGTAPVDAYQRSFAAEIIARALARLHDEARQSDHLDMLDALLPYLTAQPAPGDYEAIARRLGQRPLALIVALKRLRQRFRELVGRELSDTVDSPADLIEEQRTLRRPPSAKP